MGKESNNKDMRIEALLRYLDVWFPYLITILIWRTCLAIGFSSQVSIIVALLFNFALWIVYRMGGRLKLILGYDNLALSRVLIINIVILGVFVGAIVTNVVDAM